MKTRMAGWFPDSAGFLLQFCRGRRVPVFVSRWIILAWHKLDREAVSEPVHCFTDRRSSTWDLPA
jgi:hypothetical protein